MKLVLETQIPKSDHNVRHGEPILLLGSCFADSTLSLFQSNGFAVTSNPHGVLFHPIALCNAMDAALEESTEIEVFQRDDLYFSWEAGAKIFGYDEQELANRIMAARGELRSHLLTAKTIVLTLGTAWGYSLKNRGILVANCHKANPNLFEKQLSAVEEMTDRLSRTLAAIQEVNPGVEFVLTVSPVRYAKDGLIDNNRSKARLLETVHELSENTTYFPAYEIVIDELRDYRFYKGDLVHPSDQAVEYVWKRFGDLFFNSTTKELAKRVSKVNASMNHRSLHEKSDASEKHAASTFAEKQRISAEHPEARWY